MILKSTMNALHNVTNPYQGPENVYCVCARLDCFDPQPATVLQNKYNYNTRNAGVADYALSL